jgi:mannose-6-phosphate isomerase-like protein (cupin superfamily)
MNSETASAAPQRAAFIRATDFPPIHREAEHGGRGPLNFRRLASGDAFDSPIDFVDFTVVPPGSTIGRHEHVGNEEIYFIVAGTPLVIADGQQRRLKRGDVSVVRSFGSHELINDCNEPVEIFVVQVSI